MSVTYTHAGFPRSEYATAPYGAMCCEASVIENALEQHNTLYEMCEWGSDPQDGWQDQKEEWLCELVLIHPNGIGREWYDEIQKGRQQLETDMERRQKDFRDSH